MVLLCITASLGQSQILTSYYQRVNAFPPTKHHEKAPPVDKFTGEDPELRFEDWLPALQWAARWNDRGPEEQLIQLAGYLRGRA